MRRPYRLNGVPATPPTRIIPDEELPYFNTPSPSPGSQPGPVEPDGHYVTSPMSKHPASVPGSASGVSGPSSFSIEIEELPADRIDSPRRGGYGNILSIFWEYLTLFWQKV